MNRKEKSLFDILIQKVEIRFTESYPDCRKTIRDWTRSEIERFQADLNEKVQGQISERWFYDHIKTIKADSDKLPRIDMLDLLSAYCRYENWEEFVARNSVEEVEHEKIATVATRGYWNKRGLRTALAILVIAGLGIYLAVFTDFFNGTAPSKTLMPKKDGIFQFCLVDAISSKIVEEAKVQVLLDNESPMMLNEKETKQGCFEYRLRKSNKVRLAISAPYYKTDTIERVIDFGDIRNEGIPLQSDDYAMMLHFFSRNKVEDWNKRRQQLEQILSDDVVVFQVYGDAENAMGMEMMNKAEFIFKLTTPIASLKDIRILETKYSDDKISFVRFVQEGNKEE